MRIGEVARAAGVGISTLRFYERRGLVEPLGRTGGGYREYDEESVRRIKFIRRAQQLGFTLVEVAQFLDLPRAGALTGDDVSGLVAGKLGEIDTRIRDLGRMRAALVDLAVSGAVAEQCPVVAALVGD
ncbi:heavy metal-responsive transcriptional regulator [Umezawaea sp. NPDC059074]|uniref:heavy metal-responsive transcriptional regulator n=1 Tax=Umezawaea sp. NPDC059074 TaxID=3346716 RepID=UPI0036A0212B